MLKDLGRSTRLLLILNISSFAIQLLIPNLLEEYFALWPIDAGFQLWQLISYAFLHGSYSHLLFNMLGLVSFGSPLEKYWGPKRLLIFYSASVLAAAVTQIFVTAQLGQQEPTVGASGGIYGLLLGFGMMFPYKRITPLIPPISMPAWVFVSIFGSLELLLGVTGTAGKIAHFAHLGGMIGGFSMLNYWRTHPKY